MKEIDYYKNNEILENSYYQIPQELFVNGLYKENLNSDSKILYAFLLDRLSLSQKNHWFDEFGRVYLIFTREEQSVLEDVIERLYYADTLKVGSVVITNLKILSKLPLINKNNLIQLLDIVNNSSNIKNVTNYLMICLYNNLGNSNIKLQNKTANSTREYERKYPDGFFDSLYANFSYENAVASS